MTTTVRKLNLIAHVVSSEGWLGAVLAFLALSIAGLRSTDAATVRAVYLSMNLTGEFVIVPLSFLALVTGLVLALGTEWGLFWYYWVLIKFALTTGATALLLLHQFTAVAEAARLVSVGPAIDDRLGTLGIQLIVDASLAIVVLVIATALSIVKPGGKIVWRRATAKIWIFAVGLILAMVVLRHVVGGGMRHHGH